jgi:hypothetical protein
LVPTGSHIADVLRRPSIGDPMSEKNPDGLSAEELENQSATALPDKEVVSILDLNADIDLAIDAAAPIDLAVAANANVAAPIDAAVGANILSADSSAQAMADQGVIIDQGIAADATANATQDSTLDQGNDTVGTEAGTEPAPAPDGETALPGVEVPTADAPSAGDAAAGTIGSLDGDLLNVDVNVDADADVAAPVNGAVAANANVAAPIDAAVAANVGSLDSDAVAVAEQDAIITQDIEGSAAADADQSSDIQQ